MNLRLLTLSAAASAVLTAATPMVPASMSTDNGGTKSAIDAYSDGGGVVIINQAGDTKFDNSAMNGLVFKYGQKAEDSGTTLKNQVSVLSTDTSAAEKAISVKFDLAKVVINPPVNGTSCDDWNPQTVSDVWTSGLCLGNNIENQLCNDGNIQTINDKYHNGVCGGTNVEGVACDDTNALTFADKYTNGVCAGVTNGTTCNDGNALTFADKYTSGVCAGIANGTLCNDANAQTINDQYTSGVCAGTNVEGQACNDSVSHTYSDKYSNGICAGVIAQSCKDIKTITATSISGIYVINPSTPFNAYCDMTTDGGGWTLVYSAINNTAGMTASEFVNPRTNQYLSSTKMTAVVNTASNIRIKDDAGNYVQTKADNLLPIINLKQGKTLNANSPTPSDYWVGNQVGSLVWATANSGCVSGVNGATLPIFYWGCGVASSAHITTSGTQKGWTDGSYLNLDIFVR